MSCITFKYLINYPWLSKNSRCKNTVDTVAQGIATLCGHDPISCITVPYHGQIPMTPAHVWPLANHHSCIWRLLCQVELNSSVKERAQTTHTKALAMVTAWGLEDLLKRRGIMDVTKGLVNRDNLRWLYETMVKREQVCLKPDLVSRVEAMLAIGTSPKRKAPAALGSAARSPQRRGVWPWPRPSCSQDLAP